MSERQSPDRGGDDHAEGGSGFATAGLSILAAADIRKAAATLLQGLRDGGVPPVAVAWTDHGEILFEPPEAASPARVQAATDAFAGRAPASAQALDTRLLPPGAEDAGAVLLAPPGSLAALEPAQARLLALAGRRLSELFSIQRLQTSVKDLEQAEQLQHALFAIADMAASDRDMQSLLRGLHQIIGRLMYAENFYIALYDRQQETIRFIYFADEMDGRMYDPEVDIPTSQMGNSITLGLIRHGRPVRGASAQITEMLGLAEDGAFGTPSIDFMGVPMRRDGQIVGALVVQSYREGMGYTQSDCAVLGFVAEHVLNAVERKRGQEALEQRVADRTRELAEANAQLQAQIAERERAAHLQATLYRIAALANNQESDEDFYRSIHQAVGELIDAESFYIALVSDDGATLRFPYSVDAAGEQREARPMSQGLSEYMLRHGKTLLIDTAGVRGLVDAGEIDRQHHNTRTSAVCWLGAPLLGPDGVIGLVVVQSYRPDLIYSAQDAELLTFVAHQIASSVQRRQHAEALRNLNAELEQRVQVRTRELRREISVREQVEAQLKHQVMHDPLTGLPNRLYLRDRLERALSSQQRNPQHGFALLYLDVDRFKLFNDSLGHLAGDAVLREVSRRLLECVRGPDIVSRLSGDEFAILLEEGQQPATACKIAQRIQARMQEPIHVGERELQASVSIGIAISHPRYLTIDEMLHDADVALYRAKATGRQRFVLFDETQQKAAMNVLELELELRNALHAGEFRPYFQPIVRLDDGAAVGYEALIRWQHPTRGVLGPGEFLPVAEESGMIEAIDWHMYRLACTAGAALVAGGGYVSINISPRHFQYEDFDQRLLELLRDTGLAPAQLRIEVTESTLLGDPEAAARILQRLQDAGVGTALDDFGTGYSSLSYVHRFPLRTIKIDRSFIRDLGQEGARRSSAIIEAVQSLARSLSLNVVAEGVETECQRQALLAVGCPHAQGFLFGRPEPASHWLERPVAAGNP
ncbi:EAL domain-containing protein [Thermomonas brevis]|uniref:EAL domain-containing protein n=1 Tax=Thermomonas brevis TaxID=215691 RepID=A0A7G9QXF8_9GAMM|nr:GGDEF domain-containing protein [Thermomonas brevis]QNN48033.1 EAL domain-containing protein [Thermomonas brevis]